MQIDNNATQQAYSATYKPTGYLEAAKALGEGKKAFIQFEGELYQIKYLFNHAVNVITWFDMDGCSHKFYSHDTRYSFVIEEESVNATR